MHCGAWKREVTPHGCCLRRRRFLEHSKHTVAIFQALRLESVFLLLRVDFSLLLRRLSRLLLGLVSCSKLKQLWHCLAGSWKSVPRVGVVTELYLPESFLDRKRQPSPSRHQWHERCYENLLQLQDRRNLAAHFMDCYH